jgi:hypothetical protein
MEAPALYVEQGCQMAYISYQNTNLGQFRSALQRTMLAHLRAIWSILLPAGTFCSHFGVFFPFWYVVAIQIWQPRCRTRDGAAIKKVFRRGHLQGCQILIGT